MLIGTLSVRRGTGLLIFPELTHSRFGFQGMCSHSRGSWNNTITFIRRGEILSLDIVFCDGSLALLILTFAREINYRFKDEGL